MAPRLYSRLMENVDEGDSSRRVRGSVVPVFQLAVFSKPEDSGEEVFSTDSVTGKSCSQIRIVRGDKVSESLEFPACCVEIDTITAPCSRAEKT